MNKTAWFASWRKGLLKLNYSQGESWEHISPPDYPELSAKGCWAVTRDKNGNFWIGYNNGYLAVYNPDGINGLTDINFSKDNLPKDFYLSQNYPNPFNPTTTIQYSLPNVGQLAKLSYTVTLKVYEVLGRKVATLANKKQSPGNYEVTFNASSLPSGIYFYKLTAGNFTNVKKMILMK